MTKKIQYVTVNNTDDELRKALLSHGVKVAKGWTRDILIRKAEEIKIWRQVLKSVVPDSFKQKYGPEQNCGDDIAATLAELDVAIVARQNGIDLSRWEGKNPGMVRMNLGNVLRGRVRRGEYVVLGDYVYNEHNKVAYKA